MNYKQPYERLIKIDEEVFHENSSGDDCSVGTNEKKKDVSGFNFVVNGTHVHIKPEHLKYISLITLTVQNAALNLTMRAANTQREKFSSAVAVTVAEIVKFITCLVVICIEEKSVKGAFKSFKSNVIFNYMDTLKVAVPSFVYYIQNNLLYVGSTHLDAATGQVTYQLKILTTAVFSVLMLDKKLSRLQWLSLVILFIGVASIEALAVKDHSEPANHRNEKPMIGIMALLCACCLSGFAGVYFEKILKNTSNVSLWIRNVQLSMASIPFGILQLMLMSDESLARGYLHGFTPLTWFCILLQVQGGLLVAVVVKYANNILKGFATSLAIVISTLASMVIFDFELTLPFVVSASLVIGSVMLYNRQ